ncbi:hypothetical protein HYDPIDRAFT_24700 [Hydnomerulius pinastri MD-312]|nr:hypothetical protein HYDPIDRAFT_24700 [Hydnomerulius pinastri MD-312]
MPNLVLVTDAILTYTTLPLPKVSTEEMTMSALLGLLMGCKGACGATNSASDWIVALNSGCPTCDYGGLDLSQGLFQHFAPTSVGELYGNWYYGSASPTPTPPPPTTTSSTPAWTPPPTTSSTSSSVYSATTSTPTSTSSSATSTSSTSSGLSPVPTFTPQDPQILVQINVGLLEFGSLLQASLSF